MTLGGCTGIGLDVNISGNPLLARPATQVATGIAQCPGKPTQSTSRITGDERYTDQAGRRPDARARYRLSLDCDFIPR
jgi:hypothetical protein